MVLQKARCIRESRVYNQCFLWRLVQRWVNLKPVVTNATMAWKFFLTPMVRN